MKKLNPYEASLAVPDRWNPAPYGTVVLEGMLGERMETNRERRLGSIDPKSLIECFLTPPQDARVETAWAGEHAGKFLEAAGNCVAHTSDAKLKAVIEFVTHAMISAQSNDGYLGTLSAHKRWTGWDVWVHKYNLLGLLRIYELTGRADILEACIKIGNLLCTTFGVEEGQLDIALSGEHMGMASTSVLEPMCALYRLTGNSHYLEFCHYLVAAGERPHAARILSSLLSHGDVYETANAKAYEMLSNLNGLLDLYQLTGETRLFDACTRAYENIVESQLYPTGTVSALEFFQPSGRLLTQASSDVGETCATVTWLQFAWRLFRITGEAKFGQEIERTLYNHLLAAQHPREGSISYYTSYCGCKEHTTRLLCCVSSGPRGIAMMPQLIYGTDTDGICLNLLVQGQAQLTWSQTDIALGVRTDFPLSGVAEIQIDPERPVSFTLKIRVPEWAAGFTARIQAVGYEGEPGKFLEIHRLWSPGEKIYLNVDVPSRTVGHEGAGSTRFLLQRGPQVLGVERTLNPGLRHLWNVEPVRERGQINFEVAERRSTISGGTTFSVECIVAADTGRAAKPATVILAPFADCLDYSLWVQSEGCSEREPIALTRYQRAGASSWNKDFGPKENTVAPPHAEEHISDGKVQTYCSADPLNSTLRRHLGLPPGSQEDPVWFAVLVPNGGPVRQIEFRYGRKEKNEGWFVSETYGPSIEIVRRPHDFFERFGNFPDFRSAPWEPIAASTVLPGLLLLKPIDDGAGWGYSVRLPESNPAYAVRIVGRACGRQITCSTLAAYDTH